MYVFYILTVISTKWSSWHEIHPSNCDRKKLTVTLQ